MPVVTGPGLPSAPCAPKISAEIRKEAADLLAILVRDDAELERGPGHGYMGPALMQDTRLLIKLEDLLRQAGHTALADRVEVEMLRTYGSAARLAGQKDAFEVISQASGEYIRPVYAFPNQGKLLDEAIALLKELASK